MSDAMQALAWAIIGFGAGYLAYPRAERLKRQWAERRRHRVLVEFARWSDHALPSQLLDIMEHAPINRQMRRIADSWDAAEAQLRQERDDARVAMRREALAADQIVLRDYSDAEVDEWLQKKRNPKAPDTDQSHP